MNELHQIHVACAYVTGASFALRGVLALRQSGVLRHRFIRTAPHIIDTVLFSSALAMLYLLSLNPLETAWLLAKVVALLAYIGFGFLMLRFGRTHKRRIAGFIGGLLAYGYIVGVAHTKSVLSWLT